MRVFINRMHKVLGSVSRKEKARVDRRNKKKRERNKGGAREVRLFCIMVMELCPELTIAGFPQTHNKTIANKKV